MMLPKRPLKVKIDIASREWCWVALHLPLLLFKEIAVTELKQWLLCLLLLDMIGNGF